MEEKFSLALNQRGKLPSLPFLAIKNKILGKKYSLSLAYIDEKKARELNKKYRGQDKPTNVLAFPLRKSEGEILISPITIKKEVSIKKNYKTFTEGLLFLVIHAMLHLKGMEHSSTMERAEKDFFEKYNEEYFGGHRRRDFHDESRGRRILKGRKKS